MTVDDVKISDVIQLRVTGQVKPRMLTNETLHRWY